MKHFTGESILKIPLSNPEKLFSGDLVIAKKEYHELLKEWHPDRNKDVKAGEISTHICLLYEEAKKLIESNRWKGKGSLVFSLGGKIVEAPYTKTIDFEIGECFHGRNHIIYAVKKEYDEFFRNATSKLAHLPFANDDMEKQISRFIPKKKARYLSTPDRLVMLIDKTEDMIPLKDLLNYHNGKIDPAHVAWMVNSLYNICCYLNYAGLVHLNIDVDTCLVSAKYHAVYLMGGWWYTLRKDETLQYLPVKTVNTLSSAILRDKKAQTIIDLECVKAVGRELLGDRTGEYLKYDKSIPERIVRFLREPSTENAIEDYRLWKQVLYDCYGPPKFIKMDIDTNLFY